MRLRAADIWWLVAFWRSLVLLRAALSGPGFPPTKWKWFTRAWKFRRSVRQKLANGRDNTGVSPAMKNCLAASVICCRKKDRNLCCVRCPRYARTFPERYCCLREMDLGERPCKGWRNTWICWTLGSLRDSAKTSRRGTRRWTFLFSLVLIYPLHFPCVHQCHSSIL